MVRLVLGQDIFQLEWITTVGFHSRRVNEEMPPIILQKTQDVLAWATQEVATKYGPDMITSDEIRNLNELIRKSRERLRELGVPNA